MYATYVCMYVECTHCLGNNVVLVCSGNNVILVTMNIPQFMKVQSYQNNIANILFLASLEA
eukprot:COSAG01_NODE_8011_length_2954_cov_232.884764_3_plen_61_part_00